MPAGRSEERALTTAIAAGLIGLPVPAVEAPPGLTDVPASRGFARALDQATAPPPEASPTQGSPPPDEAVAAPASNASHEAGTAASASRSPLSTQDADIEEETPTSTPDRPAGAVEGGPETIAFDTSALEAMMAAVLFRPMSEPEKAGVEPAAPGLLQPQVGIGPAAPALPALHPMEAEASAATLDAIAQAVEATSTATPGAASATASHVTSGLPARGARPFSPDPDMTTPAAALAIDEAVGDGEGLPGNDGAGDVHTPIPLGIGATNGPQSPVALPAFDGEPALMTPGGSTEQMDSAVASETAPRETVLPPLLGLIEGVSGDQSDAARGPAARPAVSASTRSDSSGRLDLGGASARQMLVSSQPPVADVPGTNSVTAARASTVQPMPLARQVADTVHAALLRGDHEIRLLLNPGELGRIDIRITEQAGALRLHLDASHGPTRDLLAREMPALQQALEARDLRVERIQVSHSGSASAGNSGAAWQGFGGQASGGQGGQQERDGSPAWSPVAGLPQSATQPEAQRTPRIIRHHGTLDRVA